jgi:hypothetical protein
MLGAVAAIAAVALGACSGELVSPTTSDAAAPDAAVDAQTAADVAASPDARRCVFTGWALDQDVVPGSGPLLLQVGGSSGNGLTVEDVEAVACPGKDAPNLLGDGVPTMAWGTVHELAVEYDAPTRLVRRVVYRAGYLGSVKLLSQMQGATYEIPILRQIQKNGDAFVLDWTNATAFPGQVDELYRAVMETYAPGVPADPVGTTCIASGRCHAFLGDADAARILASLTFDALGFVIWFENVLQLAVQGSIPTRLDQILPP